MTAMPKLNASQYMQRLSQLLLNPAVTGRQGNVLTFDEGVNLTVDMLLRIRSSSGKVMLVGNGGSAAIVSHMQSDLCKAVGVRAMVFDDVPLLTALTNDNGYDTAFESAIEMWAEEGDLLLAVSSSGRSENILRAVQACITRPCEVVTFSGFTPDNPLRQMGNVNFYVESESYGHVELSHAALSHLLADGAVSASSSAESPACSSTNF